MQSILALLGGTFDPIHYGHLRVAEALVKKLDIQQVILLPNRIPPHRPQPIATPSQRLAMLQLAIADKPLFQVDQRELQRDKISYTVDTLAEIRAEQGISRPLVFIIGQDALLSLHTWYRWQLILQFCHLVVCARKGYLGVPPILQDWIKQHQTLLPTTLRCAPKGYIWFADTPLYAISATEIRESFRNGQNSSFAPESVMRYIKSQGLYL